MTENQYEILGDRMAQLYQELEQEVIADIARRVRQTGRLTETAELMARAMMETGKSPAEIRKEVMKLLRADTAYKKMVANNTKQYKRDVLHMVRQVVKNAQKLGDELIGQAGDMQWNKDLSLWHQAGKELTKDSSYYKLVQEMQKATRGTLKNLTNTMGFKGKHGYTSIMNAYVNTMDKALIKLTSGAFSMDQCVNDAVRELAHSGLRTIDYASGRSYQLDTAARMALRTANSKLAGQITMNNCDIMGVDLVEVNAHWGSRPEHAVWQGKIYSRSGTHPKYKSIAETRYGHADGLCGINCRHQFYPFFEGVSKPNEWEPEPEPQYYKGKEYTYAEATQKQRQMERDIRATKREIETCKVLGDDTTALNSKKNRQIDEYHAFSKEMGIRPKDNRLRVGKGSTDVTKTKNYKRISESRTLDDKAKSLLTVQQKEKGDVISESKLYKDLYKSDIGKDVLKYIEDHNTSVDILYEPDTIKSYGLTGLYGLQMGNHIYINANECGSLRKVAEVIIHEAMHLRFDIGGDQHAECVCDYYAMKHRKGELTSQDIIDIIKSVKKRYPEMKWRVRA